MFIKEILKYDEGAQEAEVLVSDGQFDVIAYAQPFENKCNCAYKLYGFMAQNVVTAPPFCSVEKSDVSHFAYRLQGRVCNVERQLVSVGGLEIELDGYIPGDIKPDDFVEFTVVRVDLAKCDGGDLRNSFVEYRSENLH